MCLFFWYSAYTSFPDYVSQLPETTVMRIDKLEYEPEIYSVLIEEAQKEVNFTIVKPEYTAGYEFSHAMVFKFGGNESVMLYYKKDNQTLVIGESVGVREMPMPNATKVKIKGREAEMAEIFGVRMLRFSNEIEIVISGEISKEELIKIAESMI
jgi:hypothetical protein